MLCNGTVFQGKDFGSEDQNSYMSLPLLADNVGKFGNL